MHPCRYPCCPTLLKRSGYCDKHKAGQTKQAYNHAKLLRQQDPELREAIRIRDSSRWKKVRRLKLTESPMCEDPFNDHSNKQTTETARQVHHIKGLRKHPDLAFVWSNLMSVCTKCHSKMEQHENIKRKDEVDNPTIKGEQEIGDDGFRYF
jgi:5-methylcytosine-specific restriction endonuclease McrA